MLAQPDALSTLTGLASNHYKRLCCSWARRVIGGERSLHCLEFHRLNDLYESRRRIWLSYAFPLPGQHRARLDELKHEALVARNSAAERVVSHQKDCPICRGSSGVEDVRGQRAGDSDE